MTAISSASGSISRAAAARAARSSARRSQPSSRIASASSPSKARSATIASCRSRPIAQSSVPSLDGALEPGRVEVDRHLGRLAGARQAALLPRRQDALPGGHDLVEEDGQLAGRLDLDLLPAPDLRDGRAGLGLLEVGRDRLEPAGDRVEPLGQRRVIAGEQQEQAVADVVERERAPLPDPQLRVVEDGAADVVDLEVPLEGGLGSTARPGRSPRPRPGARARRRARRAAASRLPSPSRSSSWWRPTAVANTGLSRTSRTNRVSTRS